MALSGSPVSTENDRKKRDTRIRRLSAFMKWFVTATLALVILAWGLLIVALVVPELIADNTDMLEWGEIERPLLEVPQTQRLGFVVLITVIFSLIGATCWNMRQLFERFRKGEYFATQTLTRIVSIGTWLLSLAVFTVLSGPVGSVLLTIDYPPGERVLHVELDGGELLLLTFGGLMLVFGWIMREAALIADENRQFV
ncbi:hypothetical protein GCM10011316_23180 [Roseibium aquae]|uniref:DUF2975 domain-containing protein n=1 Tax=Roseibium aquae TaxID=1323746 RepID=A0A916TKI1_9HYPH|nr:DUF2975 domain-containing protein [Roseibium aquae]GGB50405.1 hypothetical protein GCM10011316_23180 [Roseibium aquae]